MSKYTRRTRTHSQHAGSPWPPAERVDPESFPEAEKRVNTIISNVQTTREDLQKELVMYEQKMTVLETEFTQYQKLAVKVMAALDVIDSMTTKLTGADATLEKPAEPVAEVAPKVEQK
jgi:predicted ribosome quality control (RQC) complex YloA/Tae2 family protein